MTDLEKTFWLGHKYNNKYYGILYDENKERLAWFWLLLVFCSIFFFYVGWWISALNKPELDIPYLTADDLIDQENDLLTQTDQDNKVLLLVGCDKREYDTGRTDTIMLAFLNAKEQKVQLLSVPRDTYVQIAGTNTRTKINHAYAYGGIDLTMSTLEQYLGINIDNYVEIEFSGFENLIDSIGGIYIEVESDMVNEAEDINLKAGGQTLMGKDALGYVRWRESVEADLGRIKRQQKFMAALAQKLLDNASLWRMPKLVASLLACTTTDMTNMQIMTLANTYKKISIDSFSTVMLPGESKYINQVSYYVGDEAQIEALMQSLLNPGETETEATEGQTTQK